MLLRKSHKLSRREADGVSPKQLEILLVNYSLVVRIAYLLLNVD